jgi:hypothetical protein
MLSNLLPLSYKLIEDAVYAAKLKDSVQFWPVGNMGSRIVIQFAKNGRNGSLLFCDYCSIRIKSCRKHTLNLLIYVISLTYGKRNSL